MTKAETEPTEELTVQLKKLNVKLAKQLSFKHELLISIVRGIGYAIGAGIIAGLIIAILSWTVNSIQDVPVLNDIFASPEIKNALDQFAQ